VPELPEVETVYRTLAPRLAGRVIREARFASPLVMRDDPDRAAAALRGRAIEGLRRHGKFLILDLSGGLAISIHLGMTGRLLWNGADGPYTRAVFELDRGRLVYDDIRQFGRIELGAPRAAKLGPDALSLTENEFVSRLAVRRGRIKPLLLNQAFLSGLGNIYADEALFRARIHPLAPAEKIGPERARRLWRAISEVLSEAVASGGSSISDYVDAEGRQGSFQLRHRVYGKEGEKCVVCGARIRRIVVGQRGTHYCPRCQRSV
jgi:formamidopyrimidine-DNA glycosylase